MHNSAIRPFGSELMPRSVRGPYSSDRSDSGNTPYEDAQIERLYALVRHGVAQSFSDTVDAARRGEPSPRVPVRFVDAASLGPDTMGTYAATDGGTIYLDRRLLHDSDALQATFSEKIGQHVEQIGQHVAAEPDGADNTPIQEVCTVEARFNPIGTLNPTAHRLLPHHGYVVTTDHDGSDYLRGGPSAHGSPYLASSRSTSSGSSPHAPGAFGTITTEYGPYEPGTVDYTARTVPSAMIAEIDGDCDAVEADMRRAAENIDASRTPYRLLGPNSNSVAREMLDRAGFNTGIPPVLAPGWNVSLP